MTLTMFIYIDSKVLYQKCDIEHNDIHFILDFFKIFWLKGRFFPRRSSVVVLLPWVSRSVY